MALTPEQTEYYDAFEEMFSTKGYKLLIDDAKAQIYQYQADSLECKTWEAACELRGKALSLAELVNMEAVTEMQKGILDAEDEIDADL